MNRVAKMKPVSRMLVPPVAINDETYTSVYVYHLLIP
jgi:hypothetical protein